MASLSAMKSSRCLQSFVVFFLPRFTARNLGNLHFLPTETPAVRGGPGEAGGVGVSPAVRRLVISMEAVSTDEPVVSESRTRQILSRITS